MKRAALLLLVALFFGTIAAMAGPYNPVVDMTVTEPSGQTKTLSAPESGLATINIANAEYGFRPTIMDSKPWMHVIVTIFKMGTSTDYTKQIGEVDLKTGGPAVASKSTPIFKVAVTKVSPPAS